MNQRSLRGAAFDAKIKGAELARHFGVTPAAVSKWLNRKTPVPDKYKREFARMIGVDVTELLPSDDA